MCFATDLDILEERVKRSHYLSLPVVVPLTPGHNSSY